MGPKARTGGTARPLARLLEVLVLQARRDRPCCMSLRRLRPMLSKSRNRRGISRTRQCRPMSGFLSHLCRPRHLHQWHLCSPSHRRPSRPPHQTLGCIVLDRTVNSSSLSPLLRHLLRLQPQRRHQFCRSHIYRFLLPNETLMRRSLRVQRASPLRLLRLDQIGEDLSSRRCRIMRKTAFNALSVRPSAWRRQWTRLGRRQ